MELTKFLICLMTTKQDR